MRDAPTERHLDLALPLGLIARGGAVARAGARFGRSALGLRSAVFTPSSTRRRSAPLDGVLGGAAVVAPEPVDLLHCNRGVRRLPIVTPVYGTPRSWRAGMMSGRRWVPPPPAKLRCLGRHGLCLLSVATALASLPRPRPPSIALRPSPASGEDGTARSGKSRLSSQASISRGSAGGWSRQ